MCANPPTKRLAAFVRGIRIDVHPGAIPAKAFLPGLEIQYGAIVIDERQLAHPCDILHEAGHIAVNDPALRNVARLTPTDGDEIATLAWSFAALKHLELDPAIVFHPDGYRGGSQSLIENFSNGYTIGVLLLQYYGLTVEPKFAAERGVDPFPHMLCWLRA